MNKKFFILTFAILITFLILFQLYGAIQINTFDNLLTSENLTFTGNENISRNITIYKNANFLSAYMNLSGYNSPTFKWYSNSNLITGLASLVYAQPEYFFLENKHSLLINQGQGVFLGYIWNGTGWTSNSTIVSGLDNSHDFCGSSKQGSITVFKNGNTISAIITLYGCTIGVVCYSTEVTGYTWNGAGWTSNSTIVSGLTQNRYDVSVEAFNYDNNLNLITTYRTSYPLCPPCVIESEGYTWNGAGWTSNSTIVSGLGDLSWFYWAKSATIKKDNHLYFINGRHSTGYTWNGAGWTSNSTIVSGLTHPNTVDSVVVFNTSISKFHLLYYSAWGTSLPTGFNTSSLISNVSILINNTPIWSHTGIFDKINHKTSDFSTNLQDIFNNNCSCSECSLSGNNCTIPLTFHSDITGILKYSDININWNESISPNLTIDYPVNDTTIITQDINIRITSADDWEIDKCYFNITRGASTEVANTEITNCSSYDISVSSWESTYTLNVWVNDTSGNLNSSSLTFKVSTPSAGSSPSPGGGSTTIIVGDTEAQWSMETSSGGAIYDLKMSAGSIRSKSIFFENLGSSLREIELDCEGELCEYVEFEKEFIILPLTQEIKTVVDFTIELPEDIEYGEYTFNIIGKDDNENSGILTNAITVGEFGFITELFTKLFTEKKSFGKFNIPYLLLSILIFPGIWAIFNYGILKKIPGKAGMSILFALFIGSWIILLI